MRRRHTEVMAGLPPPTLYHRWLGWRARALRRVVVAACLGLLATAVLWTVTRWQVALAGGWNVMALVFLSTTWPIILRADGTATRKVAVVEDETRGSAAVLLLGASVASLVGAVSVLHLAGRSAEPRRVLLVALAASTVVVSWATVNTVFVLRYAHIYFALPDGAIDFGEMAHWQPDYRDFAYVAFTVGMTYQVSDTALRHKRIRRTVLLHALLSYMFGVVIVSGAVNLIASLIR